MHRPISHRPPPLVLRTAPTISSTPLRRNDFREPATPKSSILTATFAKAQQLQRKNSLKTKTPEQRSGIFRALRVMADTAHSALCMFLIMMMAFYVSFDQEAMQTRFGGPAVGLMVISGVDMMVNFYGIAYFDRPVAGWASLTKCFLIFGYIVIFLDYLGNSGPFPKDYSFWNIKPSYTDAVIYIFIWVISVWDVAIIIVYREVLLNWLTNMVDYIQEHAETHEASRKVTGVRNKWYREQPRRQRDFETGTINEDIEAEAAAEKVMETDVAASAPFVGKAL